MIISFATQTPVTALWVLLAYLVVQFIDNNFIVPRIPTTTIDSIIKDSPAEKAGLMVGDKIISINGNPTNYFHEVQKNIHGMHLFC